MLGNKPELGPLQAQLSALNLRAISPALVKPLINLLVGQCKRTVHVNNQCALESVDELLNWCSN